ncbi:hypothetical protein FBY10_105303 [Pseudomonas sp. SJZ103]|jgi:hypothetical protein|nr:hypothetical protein FBY10_105303 [Pseudomonas sp. SJZ103]TWC87337.1 hypothetical protein FBY08_10477 [Pseudomonas sp. SJZ094]
MSAEQAEVVCQYMAIQFFAKLGANSAATYTAGQSTEDGARHCADGDAKRDGQGAESCA